MLIVAMPKSASTSLMATLGEINKCQARQLSVVPWLDRLSRVPVAGPFFRRLSLFPATRLRSAYRSPEFTAIREIHSDICELTPELIGIFSAPHSFWKQHVIPTPGNIRGLSGTRKVLLLREPEASLSAYRRTSFNAAWKTRLNDPYYAASVLSDLHRFRSMWTEYGDANTLTIDFEQLVTAPRTVINRIQEFFGLPPADFFEFRQERYSGFTSAV